LNQYRQEQEINSQIKIEPNLPYIYMDFKKIKTETTAVTRQKDLFYRQTGNIYETVAILSKRANQISAELKEELNRKIAEFGSSSDNLEEIFENREQIELAKFYEKLPKPTLIAIHEFLNDQVYFRNPHKDTSDF
jgi:DNA-directed RNA polymerase subunit K/omega